MVHFTFHRMLGLDLQMKSFISMNVAWVWGKAKVVEEQRGRLLCINGAARWPVTALQLTDSLCCREAARTITALSCMQTAPSFMQRDTSPQV